MLNKVLVAKFLTAMTLAGLATGAAAGIDVDDPADDGETIELETPFGDDDDSSSSDDDTTADDADDADDSDADEADDDAADDEAEEVAEESDDDAVAEEPKADTHGSIVSNCARNTTETGRAHGEAVSAVAKDDTVACAGLVETAGDDEEAPALADEADEADADDEDAEEDEPRASKAKGADHRDGKASEKLAGRDARKAGR